MDNLDDYEQFFNNYKNYFSTTEEDKKEDDKIKLLDEKQEDKRENTYICQLI
jgi:hypothetical protein